MTSRVAENGSLRMALSTPSPGYLVPLRTTRRPSKTLPRSSCMPMTSGSGATGSTPGALGLSADFEQVGYNKWAGRAMNAPTLAPPTERCDVAKHICSTEGCERFVVARGLCSFCWWVLVSGHPHRGPLGADTGGPGTGGHGRLPEDLCTRNGCGDRSDEHARPECPFCPMPCTKCGCPDWRGP
jgi:hypothetical protein